MRVIVVMTLFLLSGACVFVSLGPLHNLWSDYQDSPTITYLVLGLPPLALGIVLFAVAVRRLLYRT